MVFRFRRVFAGFMIACSLWSGGKADLVSDIARIHVEAVGGDARLMRLKGLRTSGVTKMGDQEIRFQLWAERPNRIRVETFNGNQTMIQAWDGESDPWIQLGYDGPVTGFSPGDREEFMAEAEYDDVLFRSAERGYSVDFAGEMLLEGRSVIKLLVTRNLTQQFVLYLDSSSYVIIRRDDITERPDGSVDSTHTLFGEFRPVLGVILPHRVTLYRDGALVYEAQMDWMEPNPPVEPGFFSRPEGEGEPDTPPEEEVPQPGEAS